MTWPIRRLGAGDEGLLRSLAEEAPEFDLAGRSAPEPPLPDEYAGTYLADPSVVHWVAEGEGRVVGELLCHVLRLPSGPGRELLLYSIGVRASDRRRGVGAALVREMLRWMKSEGIPEAWVLADNPGAEAFYAACGFEHGGEHDQGVLMLLSAGAETDNAWSAAIEPTAARPCPFGPWPVPGTVARCHKSGQKASGSIHRSAEMQGL